MAITREELEEIFSQDGEAPTFETKDRALRGILILLNYFDSNTECIINAAEHDMIYTVDVDILIEKGITKDHAELLRSIGWFIEEDCLCHFV